MSLSEEERKVVVNLELKKATETFEEIEILFNAKKWSGAANRLYYSVFHAISALLIYNKHQVYSHHGSHAIFHKYFIKTGILPEEYGLLYNRLQTMREEGDYNCAYDVTEEELLEQIEPARQLLIEIKHLTKQD